MEEVMNGELVHVPREQGILRPAESLDDLAAAFRGYQDLSKKLLDDNDYQVIQGKKFKKKSAWRKFATAFNLSDEVVEKRIEKDETGQVIYAEFVVQVTAPNGRTSMGWGACSIKERGFSKPDHDIPATAHTRAKNRAIADMVGFGELSAEEVEAEPGKARPAAAADLLQEAKSLAAQIWGEEADKELKRLAEELFPGNGGRLKASQLRLLIDRLIEEAEEAKVE